MTWRNALGSTPSFFLYGLTVFWEQDIFSFEYSPYSLDFIVLHQQPVELVPLGTQIGPHACCNWHWTETHQTFPSILYAKSVAGQTERSKFS